MMYDKAKEIVLNEVTELNESICKKLFEKISTRNPDSFDVSAFIKTFPKIFSGMKEKDFSYLLDFEENGTEFNVAFQKSLKGSSYFYKAWYNTVCLSSAIINTRSLIKILNEKLITLPDCKIKPELEHLIKKHNTPLIQKITRAEKKLKRLEESYAIKNTYKSIFESAVKKANHDLREAGYKEKV